MLATLFGGKLLNLLVVEWYIGTVAWSIGTQNYTYKGDKIMMKNGSNYRKLVTRITGKDWEGDSFNRLLVHHHPEELDEYIEHLYCCDYKKVKVLDTREQEIAIIDTPYDEEVNKTRKLIYEYFMDRVYDIDGEYLCERLGITPETLKEQLDYLLGEV